MSTRTRRKKRPVWPSSKCWLSRMLPERSKRNPDTAWIRPGPSGQSTVRTYAVTRQNRGMSLMAGDGEADAERRRGLRRMRTVATGLLVVAAVVFLATLGHGGWIGFVNAGAEASMVGAIADWFAVTALFKHPLGLPVPHTALIPRRKDELGRSLEEFVGENFLQESVIRERIASASISLRVGQWLIEPVHVRRVVDEFAEVASIGL